MAAERLYADLSWDLSPVSSQTPRGFDEKKRRFAPTPVREAGERRGKPQDPPAPPPVAGGR